MKTTKKLTVALILLSSLWFATTANAILINLTLADTRYIGQIDDGIPSSDAHELSWVNQLIDMGANDVAGSIAPIGETLTRSANVFLGLPDATAGTKMEDNSDRTVGSALFALGKYGGQVKMTHIWYLGGLDAADTVSLIGARSGLSHTTLFGGTRTNVPDSGSSLILLGLGLGLLGFIKRRK